MGAKKARTPSFHNFVCNMSLVSGHSCPFFLFRGGPEYMCFPFLRLPTPFVAPLKMKLVFPLSNSQVELAIAGFNKF